MALRPPALVFEHALHPVTTWFVLPVFALFNAGIALEGVAPAQLASAGVLGGIGFTMSIFVAGLAFPDEALQTAAKAGILAASALSGAAGYLLLRAVLPAPAAQEPPAAAMDA